MFPDKPIDEIKTILDNEPKDTIIVPVTTENGTVSEDITNVVDEAPLSKTEPIKIIPPPEPVKVDSLKELSDNTELGDKIVDTANDIIAQIETTTEMVTTTVTTTVPPPEPAFIQPSNPVYVLPATISQPEFDNLVTLMEDEKPVTIIVGDTIIAQDDLPTQVEYPADVIAFQPPTILSDDIVKTLKEIPNFENNTIIPVLTDENENFANYLNSGRVLKFKIRICSQNTEMKHHYLK